MRELLSDTPHGGVHGAARSARGALAALVGTAGALAALAHPASAATSQRSHGHGAATGRTLSRQGAAQWVTIPAPAVALPPAPGPVVTPPASIASNCSADVSSALQAWLQSLPDHTTAAFPIGSCYLIDKGVVLDNPQRLTLRGGTFREQTPGGKGRRAFRVVGGSDVTFEDMTIEGPNAAHVYDAARAFQGAIELDGTETALVDDVTVHDVFGDGITIDPLRGGADHNSGHIVRPSTNVTVEGSTIDGAGRQGIALVSVKGALITGDTFSHVALDTFDLEADQANEGAQNVWIRGTTSSSSAGLWFANAGESKNTTGNIYVSANTMQSPQAGEVALVQAPPGSRRGPIVLAGNHLQAGASAYVAAFQIAGGAGVTIESNDVVFQNSTVPALRHEAIAHVTSSPLVQFLDNTFVGAGRPGTSVRSVVRASGNVIEPPAA